VKAFIDTNVLRRKRAVALPDVEALCTTLIDTCDVVDLSFLSAAALSDCAILYSEDMQDGLNIKLPGPTSANALAIRSPFRDVAKTGGHPHQ